MPYSLSYNLKKEMGLKYSIPFGKYYRGDIVLDHFENSEEEDAETWVTDFCHWASQENLRDSWKLKFAMEAMNHTDVFWAKKQKAVGTWENFCISSERGSWGIANTGLVNGEYRALDCKMEDYLNQVWRIVDDFESFQIDHILRECNKEADKVANKRIDKHMSRREALQSENPLYKTQLCRYWSGGYCCHEPDSVSCQFAHGEEDLMSVA